MGKSTALYNVTFIGQYLCTIIQLSVTDLLFKYGMFDSGRKRD